MVPELMDEFHFCNSFKINKFKKKKNLSPSVASQLKNSPPPSPLLYSTVMLLRQTPSPVLSLPANSSPSQQSSLWWLDFWWRSKMEFGHKFITISVKKPLLNYYLSKIDSFSPHTDDNINGGTNLPRTRELKDHFSNKKINWRTKMKFEHKFRDHFTQQNICILNVKTHSL